MCGPGEHRVPLDPRRQRNRTVNFRAGPLGRVDDLRGALIEHRVIVGFHPNANDFVRRSGHAYQLLGLSAIQTSNWLVPLFREHPVGHFLKFGETEILKPLGHAVNARRQEIQGTDSIPRFSAVCVGKCTDSLTQSFAAQ